VGLGLVEHPVIRLIYRMNVPTYSLAGGLLQKTSLLAKYLLKGQGPLASAFEAMAFLRTSAAEQEPDVQLHFVPLGFDVGSDCGKPAVQMLPYPSVTVYANKSHPISRGRVRLAASDPKAPPLIEPRLLASDEDVETLVRGIATVRRIMATAPMAKLVSEEVRPGADYTELDSMKNYVRDNTEVAYHPAGTCRMGADDEAVVTPELRVRGIENLWIADASIMPDLISGNTNAVCMMIGMKLGAYLNVHQH
jgi:choline dehydrogenase-like flavoprotein